MFDQVGNGGVTVVHHGGDSNVRRDSKGRPLLLTPCFTCDGSGRIPSEKRPGNTVQCPKKCEGVLVEKAFTRVTTHIDVLDDKSNLMDWKLRMVLRGLALQPGILTNVLAADPTTRDGKQVLNALAQKAMKVAGSEDASNRGTELHSLTELVDAGLPLPADASLEDIIMANDYEALGRSLKPVMIERLVVNDELGVAGTPDRIEEYIGEEIKAPNGAVIQPGDHLITDLKTGSLYGGLKMAMQLAIYSRSTLYDADSPTGRADLGNVRQDWGLIKSVPANGGPAGLYWANLDLGWEAVLLAGRVREMRNEGRKALTEFVA